MCSFDYAVVIICAHGFYTDSLYGQQIVITVVGLESSLGQSVYPQILDFRATILDI